MILNINREKSAIFSRCSHGQDKGIDFNFQEQDIEQIQSSVHRHRPCWEKFL